MCSQVGSLIGLFTKNPPNSVNVSLAKHCMNKLPFSVTKCVNAKRRKKKKVCGFSERSKGIFVPERDKCCLFK